VMGFCDCNGVFFIYVAYLIMWRPVGILAEYGETAGLDAT